MWFLEECTTSTDHDVRGLRPGPFGLLLSREVRPKVEVAAGPSGDPVEGGVQGDRRQGTSNIVTGLWTQALKD